MFQNFEQLKNFVSPSSSSTNTALIISPQSLSKVEKFEKPMDETFAEALENQPSPPPENFSDVYIDPEVKAPEPSKPKEEVFEDAKEEPKRK